MHHRYSIRQTQSRLSARQVLIMGATASLIPISLISVSLFAQGSKHKPGTTNKTEVNSSSAQSLIENTESTPPTETNIQAESKATESGASVSVHVNGEEVPIPPSGNINETIPTEDGTVSVQVQGNPESGDADNDRSSSINVNINSDRSNNSDTDMRTRIRIRQR